MKIGRILALLFFLALVWQVVWIARGIKANSAHEVSTRADAIENGLSNYVDRAGRARSLIEAAFAKHKRLNEQYWKSHPEDSKGVHYLGYPTESEIIAIMGPPLFDITTQNETLPKLGKKLWGFGDRKSVV